MAMGATPLPWYHHGLRERSFQDRKQNPDPEGVALPAHGETMGRGAMTLENQSWRVFETRRHPPQRLFQALE